MIQSVSHVAPVSVAGQAATASVIYLLQKKSGPVGTLAVMPGGFGMVLHFGSELQVMLRRRNPA